MKISCMQRIWTPWRAGLVDELEVLVDVRLANLLERLVVSGERGVDDRLEIEACTSMRWSVKRALSSNDVLDRIAVASATIALLSALMRA